MDAKTHITNEATGARTKSTRKFIVARSTPFPNAFIDKVMPLCKPSLWKALCFIWRKTMGWDKVRDFISLTQIESGAGVCRNTAIAAVRLWEKVGLVKRTERLGTRGTKEYELVLPSMPRKTVGKPKSLLFDAESAADRLSQLVQKTNRTATAKSSSKNEPLTRSEYSPVLVEKMRTQKALLQEAPPIKARTPDSGLSDLTPDCLLTEEQDQNPKTKPQPQLLKRSLNLKRRPNATAERTLRREKGLKKFLDTTGDDTVGEFLDFLEKREGRRYPAWWPELERICKKLEYTFEENDPLVSVGFLLNLQEVVEKHEKENLSPAILACKIIDECMKWPDRTAFPPDFAKLRDRLRAKERKLAVENSHATEPI